MLGGFENKASRQRDRAIAAEAAVQQLREALERIRQLVPQKRNPITNVIARIVEEGLREIAKAGTDAMFICGKWKKLSDGCVARCDLPSGHKAPPHLDSVIGIGWKAGTEEGWLLYEHDGYDSCVHMGIALDEFHRKAMGGNAAHS